MLYAHDCDNCEFLETVDLTHQKRYKGKYDIYICRSERYPDDIIARASDEPSDNYSWDIETLDRLPEDHPLRQSKRLRECT